MSEPRDLPAIVASAEQAAAAGDYEVAARHLRSAIGVQEATLGPGHPDVANTLNNLGVICERAGNTVEAEHSYRQAYAVARAALEPEHPFVITSARNLREFCETWGRPFELPTASPTVPARDELPAAPAPARSAQTSSPSVRRRPSLPISYRALAILGVAGLVLTWLAAGGPLRPRRDVARSATGATPGTSEEPASSASAPAGVTAPESRKVESPRASAASRPDDLSSRGGHDGTVVTAPPVRVARAQVCRGLSTRESNGPDWLCDPVRSSASAGTLFFYTRVASPKPTIVLHRWYRGDSLQQEVKLGVNANPEPGYRTFSRLTIGPERAGNWRVELRTADGMLLQKELFVVR